MNWFVKDRVLHGTYRSKEEIPSELLCITDVYEGAIPGRVGWNIPVSFLKRNLSSSPSPSPSPSSPSSPLSFVTKILQTEEADYLIVYPERDIQTKKHELLHARYAMNPSYKQEVHALWDSLSLSQQGKVLATLRSLHYPDRAEILMDEFQAYYYTEAPSFFGIDRPISRSLAKKKSPAAKRK